MTLSVARTLYRATPGPGQVLLRVDATFTRPGDLEAQAFARELGATWTGGSDERPGVELDAALIFAPAGELVPAALRAVRRGGRVVCGGIHTSDIPTFPYSILWGERSLRSVANLTRADGDAFMALAPKVPVRTTTTVLLVGPGECRACGSARGAPARRGGACPLNPLHASTPHEFSAASPLARPRRRLARATTT